MDEKMNEKMLSEKYFPYYTNFTFHLGEGNNRSFNSDQISWFYPKLFSICLHSLLIFPWRTYVVTMMSSQLILLFSI